MKKIYYFACYMIGLSLLWSIGSTGYAQNISEPMARDVSAFRFTEGFEGANFPPAGWSCFQVAGASNWSSEKNGHASSKTAFHDWRFGEQNTWLVSPQLQIPGSGNILLEFWSFTTNPNLYENSNVLISTSNPDPVLGNYALLKHLSVSEATMAWQKISIPLTGYLGESIYIAFQYAGNSAHGWYVDDVFVGDSDLTVFVDAELIQIITPASGTNLSASEPVKVLIKNNGSDPLANFDLKLELNGTEMATETYSGTAIPSSGQIEYTFTTTLDLSVSGSYNVKVTALVDEDANINNNSQTVSVKNTVCGTIASFPWKESFENERYDDDPYYHAPLPDCWATYCFSGCTNTAFSWDTNPIRDYVHSGKLSATRWSSIGEPADDWLVSPQIAVPATGHYVLEFWSIHNGAGAYNGIWISSTGRDPSTASFSELKQLSGDELSGTFKKIIVPLDAYAGETVYIAFKYAGASGGIWFIDDVSVVNHSGYVDVELVRIDSPVSGINLTGSEKVKIAVKNNSEASITGFNLNLELNGNAVATETYNASIASLEQVEYTFDATLDLLEAGDYEIKVTLSAPGDADPNNDSKTISVKNRVCNQVTSFPWTEDFNTGIPYCWTNIDADGDKNQWEFYVYSGNGFAASWSYSDYGELGGIVRTPDNWLITPALVLNTDLTLSYKVLAHSTYYAEKYSVLVSTTGKELSDFTEIFTETLTSGDTKTIQLPLRDYTGETVYIAFRHWDCTNQLLIGIDDVTVFEYRNHIDGAVTSILSPLSGENLTASEPVKVVLKNAGSDPISNFTVQLEVNGTEIATETYTDSLASLTQTEYTFTPVLDLSRYGEVTEIKATIRLAGDQDASNNSQTQRVAKFRSEPVYLLGYRVSANMSVSNPLGFISFHSGAPENIAILNHHQPSGGANAIFAGEYVNGDFYYYSVKYSYSEDYTPVNFVKLATDTWTPVLTVPVSVHAEEMAYDYSTATMYGLRNVGQTSFLVTVNMETGALTTVGRLGSPFITLACNTQGQLYGIDLLGKYYAINKTNAAITALGTTGILPDYIQSMAFDHNTGRLFWAMIDNKGKSKLVELEPASGVIFNRGTIEDNSEIVGLFTRYVHTGLNNVKLADMKLYPNPVHAGRLLNILLPEGADWANIRIYDLSNRLVSQQDGVCRTVTAPDQTGIYLMEIRLPDGTKQIQKLVVK